jgi:hypothetical protein
MAREKPQVETLHKHPEPYQRDLNPNAMAGQNLGVSEPQPATQGPMAYNGQACARTLEALLR